MKPHFGRHLDNTMVLIDVVFYMHINIKSMILSTYISIYFNTFLNTYLYVLEIIKNAI